MTGNRGTTDRLRRTVRGARAWARTMVPGQLGALPDFLIIGGQRCGTTSLHHYLAAHPQVRPATGKELQYFSIHHGRGERWYRAHFPARPAGVRSFEASPYYLFHPSVPGRVAAGLPQARCIALLRDPVERAYSHYLHTRSYGAEPLPFAEAVAAEERRLADALRDGPDSPAAHTALRNHSYLARGRYAEQLRRWYAVLPADRLLVLRSEDMYVDPAGVYDRVLRFLDLDPFTPAGFAQHTRRTDRGPGELTDALRAQLGGYFAPHNADLADLLGWPHTWSPRS
ncbi:sulfotransferase domain-containing protein [Micromonospora sp. Llam0]|uniref:sulfotransferase n=1 Tax=Micromonospora sp. Llam0 TaxID=2485143 RepID=UPI000F49CABA|nr:sulfotransferase [Micromonospora sp. Llam0]ROO61666.1 sulfotransferase domain-containing protein [Micromonospora sp. Llam0]